jgi:hypothetical protein
LITAHQIDLFGVPQLTYAGCLDADHNGGYARASKYAVFTPCDVEMYAAAACGLTVARSSEVRAS